MVLSLEQAEIYDRMDQASIIRKEQLLKAQGLQSGSLEGGPRYLSFTFCLGAYFMNIHRRI